MKNNDSPLEVYMRHIAHANNIIFVEVLNNLKSDNNEHK